MANYKRIVIKNRSDAEQVLADMLVIADLYGVCTVVDMYDAIYKIDPDCGVEPRYTDSKYGWTHSQVVAATAERLWSVTGGYILNLANPLPLELCDKENKEKSEAIPYEYTRNDIKPGYAVKLRNGEVRVAMPVGTLNTLILTKGHLDKWTYLSSWKIDLKFSESAMNYHESASDFDIMEVYSCITGTDNYNRCGDVTTDHRKLLWSRVEAKKMTVAEISKELGYPVEIVEG